VKAIFYKKVVDERRIYEVVYFRNVYAKWRWQGNVILPC